VWEYAAPAVTTGSDEARISSGAGVTEIVIGVDATWAGLQLSLTDTVKVEVPLTVGVPVMAPVADWRVSPEGRAPDVTVHL